MGCDNSGGSGSADNESGTSSNFAGFSVTEITTPTSVQKNQEADISAKFAGDDSEILLYQFISNNGKNHIVPNSGILATKDKSGQLKLTYKAPAMPGKYYYYFKVRNSAGAEINKEFSVTVTE